MRNVKPEANVRDVCYFSKTPLELVYPLKSVLLGVFKEKIRIFWGKVNFYATQPHPPVPMIKKVWLGSIKVVYTSKYFNFLFKNTQEQRFEGVD